MVVTALFVASEIGPGASSIECISRNERDIDRNGPACCAVFQHFAAKASGLARRRVAVIDIIGEIDEFRQEPMRLRVASQVRYDDSLAV